MADDVNGTPAAMTPRENGRGRTLYAIGLLAIAAILYLLYFPGMMSSDSESSLAEGRAWVFSDWHPPILAIIWGTLDKLVEGPALMLCAQIVTLVFSVGVLISELLIDKTYRFKLLVVLIVLFSPMMFLIDGVIWKDIWATALIALAMGLAIRFSRSRQVSSNGYMIAAASLVASLGSILFRPNSVGAVVAVIASIFVSSKLLKGKLTGSRLAKLFVSIAVACIASIVLLFAALSFNRFVASPSHAEISVYFFDIAGTIVKSQDPERLAKDVEERYPLIVAEPGEFYSQIMESYSPEAWGVLNREWGNQLAPFSVPITEANRVQYSDAWKYVISQHPLAYLKHRSSYFFESLGFYYSPTAGRNALVLESGDSMTAENVRRVGSFFERSWLMSPGIWLIICMIAAFGLFRSSTIESARGWVGLSAIGVATTLFLLGPSPDYRYMQWPVLAGMSILISYVLAKLPFIRMTRNGSNN